MLTATGLRGDATRRMETGRNTHLSKPIATNELRELMEVPIYDRADALARIGDDEELLATLIDMFIAEAPNYLAEIDNALQAADWPRLTRAAHTLKGVLATFSAERGAASARALEIAANATDAAACGKHAAQTRIEVEAFLQAIK